MVKLLGFLVFTQVSQVQSLDKELRSLFRTAHCFPSEIKSSRFLDLAPVQQGQGLPSAGFAMGPPLPGRWILCPLGCVLQASKGSRSPPCEWQVDTQRTLGTPLPSWGSGAVSPSLPIAPTEICMLQIKSEHLELILIFV